MTEDKCLTHSKPAQPAGDTPRIAESLNAYDFALAKKRVAAYAEQGLGLDGMPLRPGQTGPGQTGPALRLADKPARPADELAKLRWENECLRAILGAALEAAFGPDWRDELRRGG